MKTPRPTIHSLEVLQAATKRLMPEVIRWLQEDKDDQDTAKIEADIAGAMEYNRDGYEIAKHLDYKGWSPDAELVDIFDAATHALYGALTPFLVAWVDLNRETLQRPEVGALVGWPKCKDKGLGAIQRVDESEATACVRFEGQAEGRGYIIAWEDLTATDPARTQPEAK